MSSDSTDSVLREVFSTIDQDGSSTLEKKELLKALMFNEDIANKLHQFPHLLPLLKPKHFQESFLAMDTSRDNHVSVEEFVAFAALKNSTRQPSVQASPFGGRSTTVRGWVDANKRSGYASCNKHN